MNGTRAAAAALAGLVVASCARSSGPGEGLQVVPLAGEVRVTDGDDSFLVDEDVAVSPGDVLSTGPDGRAMLHLGTNASLELGGQAQVRVDGEPEVVRGSVLATSGQRSMSVRAGDAQIEGTGSVFRVDRGFSVTVAVYRGAAAILGSGIGDLPALRQAVVVAGGAVPRGARPLAVRPDHPWDIRLLGAAIDLGMDLVRLERGLSRALPSGAEEAAVIRALADTFSPPLLEEVLRRVEAAETVVAAEVSRSAAELSGGSVARVLDQVLDLRGQGAHWIVVAATWGVPAGPILLGLERLAGILGRLVAPPSAPPGSEGGKSQATTGGSGGGTGSVEGGESGGSGGGSTDGSGGASTDGSGGGSTGSGGSTTTTGGDGGGGGGSSGGGSEGGTTTDQGCQVDVSCVIGEVVEEVDLPPLPGGGILP
jgi:hypothetical protein